MRRGRDKTRREMGRGRDETRREMRRRREEARREVDGESMSRKEKGGRDRETDTKGRGVGDYSVICIADEFLLCIISFRVVTKCDRRNRNFRSIE